MKQQVLPNSQDRLPHSQAPTSTPAHPRSGRGNHLSNAAHISQPESTLTGIDLGRGAVLGAVALIALWVVFATTALGDVGRFGGGSGVQAAAGVVVFFAVLFLVEEIVFRGLGTGGLAAFVGIWPATIAMSLLVASAYAFSDAATVMAVVSQVLANLVLGLARLRTGRIWMGFAFKLTWNAGMVVLGWPDSDFRLNHPVLGLAIHGPEWLTGGSFGAEAGLIGTTVLAAVIACISRLAPLEPRTLDHAASAARSRT